MNTGLRPLFHLQAPRFFPYFINLIVTQSLSHIKPYPLISPLIPLSFGFAPLAFTVSQVDGGHVTGGGDQVEGADA